MFRYILRKIKVLSYFFKQKNKTQNENVKSKNKIPKTIEEIDVYFNRRFENCINFFKRKMTVGNKQMLMAYIEGFINSERLELCIIKPILDISKQIEKNAQNNSLTINDIKNNVLPAQVTEIDDLEGTIEYLYLGYIILFLQDERHALGIKISENTARSVSKAEVENSIRGPKDALTENAFVNLQLLTNRIKSPDFKSEILTLGERTNTRIYVCYIKGIAKESIINQVKKRVGKISIDGMLDINYISEYISDNPFTLFPLNGNHERPDAVAAQLLEGRVAILCEGSPFAITVPHLFIENLQNGEDYFNKPILASFIRIIRFLAFIIALLLPALYIAFLNYEHQVTPFELLITAAAGQEKIPFTSLMETLIMVLSFEILREATLRMPRGFGQTVSIVGALVLGEAAVKAGFTSNLIIIVLALTAICSYVNTNLMDTISLYRFGYIIAADVFGLAGIVFLSGFICIHVCSLTSFGIPYMSPLSPMNLQGLKDALFRFPLKSMRMRPKGIAQDKKRRAD